MQLLNSINRRLALPVCFAVIIFVLSRAIPPQIVTRAISLVASAMWGI